jgi:5,6-dimethylbenzimidazole synthase
MWLAACAEGIGIGWVSILDYGKIGDLLGLPVGVQLIAYLCIGFPQEFRTRPMLEEVGWRSREELHRLIYQDHWGQPCGLFPGSHAPALGAENDAPRTGQEGC